MNNYFIDLMTDLKEEEVYVLVEELIRQGTDPLKILDKAPLM